MSSTELEAVERAVREATQAQDDPSAKTTPMEPRFLVIDYSRRG